MPLIYPSRLRGWRFLVFNFVLGLGHIVVLSNAGGYTILVPYAAGSLQGVAPSFGTWGTTDFMIGLALGFPIARWLAGRYGEYRLYVSAFVVYAVASLSSLAGLVYFTMIILSAPLVAVIHELIRGFDARLVACLNFLGFSFTLSWIGHFDNPSDFDQIFWPMLLMGFFLGTFFAPLAVITLHGLPGRHLLRATEEVGLLRTAAGAFGIALQGVVVYQRVPVHQLELADHVGGRRFTSLDLLQQLSGKLDASHENMAMVTRQLANLARQQATLLALNDALLLASFVFLGLAALVWLARPIHVDYATRTEDSREIRAEGLMDQP